MEEFKILKDLIKFNTIKDKQNKEAKLGFLGHTDTVEYIDAVMQIELSKLNYGIKLYFTYDEEIGFGGIYDIVKSNEKFPEFMIFGEPTYNEILVGSKGLLELNISFNGIKAHSSNPEKGKCANMNVGLIKGGSAKNSASANCDITIDVRAIKNEHVVLLKEKLKN